MAVGSSRILCGSWISVFEFSFLVCKIEDRERQWLFGVLQVFICIIEEFEEIRGFDRGKTSHSGVVLVWVILSR